MSEPTRKRVAAYEAALGCEEEGDRCLMHPTPYAWTPLGCPVAVAAARVEAERVAPLLRRIEAQLTRDDEAFS